jgi:hypothetical protein
MSNTERILVPHGLPAAAPTFPKLTRQPDFL